MHIIRLRHPWQATWRQPTLDEATQADGRGHDRTAGQLRPASYCRKFHRPSGLSDHQPVALVIELTCAAAPPVQFALHDILLNSKPLRLSAASDSDHSPTRFSARIDSLLVPFNRLEILCSLAVGEMADAQVASAVAAVSEPQRGDALSTAPPDLSHWAEVRLEIDTTD